MSIWSWTVCAGVALMVASAGAQELVICPACGREAKAGAAACGHCSAALPAAKGDGGKAAAPAAPAENNAAPVGRDAAAVVGACVRQARGLEEKQPEVALCYYQNALALMRLVSPSGDAGQEDAREAILAGNGRVLETLLRGRVPCRRCQGTGKYQLDLGKVDRAKGVKAVSGVACPACKGFGFFPGVREVAKVKMAILQGRQEFERRQMVSGDVKVGRAFVPVALEKLLNTRQRALVMTGMPQPCPECQLTARQACSTCRGSGWVKCDYAGCVKGEVKEARAPGSRQAKRMNEDLPKKCPRCEGLAEVPCGTCKGNRCVACAKCDGSGLAPRCARCTGTGLSACAKCKGTGQVKGLQCPECKGETMVLCPTCRGEGAVAR
ncbi:MAG: hypothetical protein PHV28_10965 [Kiritimatiellae bacterium]|nr:hypothetical protein [Kiritimatiellia bacterium]